MVAILGLTRTTSSPSSLKALMAWLPGIVELAGLADLEGAAAEDEDFFGGPSFQASEKFPDQKNPVSTGPGRASGWNWTERKGFLRCRIPSLVPSLAFLNQDFQSLGSVRGSTAKPWF